MRQFSIERSLHILGPVLGKKRGVDVRIGGGQACTDGNTIWLPALPIDDAEAAAHCALEVSRALQSQAVRGFTEVLVRNPETNEERVLVIPTLQTASAKPE